MENIREICATIVKNNLGGEHSFMCKHCSGVNFDEEQNLYWKCKKYNTPLKENQNKYLIRCEQCLINGDI